MTFEQLSEAVTRYYAERYLRLVADAYQEMMWLGRS